MFAVLYSVAFNLSHAVHTVTTSMQTMAWWNMAVLMLGGGAVAVVAFALLRKWLRMRSVLRLGYAGSQLQTKVIKAFTLVTILPTVIVSIFSVAFFYYGLKDWFSERITTVLEESVAVAEAYLNEHQSTLRADAMAMGNDLLRDLSLASSNPPVFAKILNTQVALRSLAEAIVLQNNRVIGRSMLSFSLSFESLPSDALTTALNGDVAIIDKGDRIFAVVAIDPFTDTYLVISRLLDSKVIEHVEQSKTAAADYGRIKASITQFQVMFVVVFVLVTVSLLLAIIWYGISFAARITRPLTMVAQATERVRAGDYSIRIEERTHNEEIDRLIRHFNRMTEQLYTQRLELTQANRMLDQRRRFSETVLSGVSAGVIALDTSLVVSLSNASAVRLLGFREEREMVGHALRSLIPEFDALLQQLQKSDSSIHEDQLALKTGGKARTLQVKISAEISHNYVEGYIVTIDDITPLIAAQRTAAWADVARRVAHEIKNPLTPIKLSAERLRKKFSPEDVTQRESFNKYLDTITRHLHDIGTIVEEFASFARMPAPKLSEIPLKPLLEKALFSSETIHPDVRFDLHMEDESTRLTCDEGQMNQVLTNLLKNAAESLERRPPDAPQGHISIFAELEGNDIVLSIVDNGVGFPEDLLHKIMEPYVTTRTKGTGLGLAIVKKIIEDHKGTIMLGNHEEGGAMVTITLPRRLAIVQKSV
jgi:two-component system, NtrC family, nitrogen regulation sensor histidine kinase NtrY